MVAQLATTDADDYVETSVLCANPECKRPLFFAVSRDSGYCWLCRVAREMDEGRVHAVAAIHSLMPTDRMDYAEGLAA